MGSTNLCPKSEQLQLWANEPELARRNLRSILLAVDSDESLIDWATEALENCGSPDQNDLEFLQNQLQSSSSDVIYWACKLIGRMGVLANTSQPHLCQIVVSTAHSEPVKQQALLALGRIGTLKDESRRSLQQIAECNSANLSSLASKLLEGPS